MNSSGEERLTLKAYYVCVKLTLHIYFKSQNIPNIGVLYTRKLSTKFWLNIQCITGTVQRGAAKATT